jgi:hypothetical protein
MADDSTEAIENLLLIDGFWVTPDSLRESGIAAACSPGKTRSACRDRSGQLYVEDLDIRSPEGQRHLASKQDRDRFSQGLPPIKRRRIPGNCFLFPKTSLHTRGHFGSLTKVTARKVMGNYTEASEVSLSLPVFYDSATAGHHRTRSSSQASTGPTAYVPETRQVEGGAGKGGNERRKRSAGSLQGRFV